MVILPSHPTDAGIKKSNVNRASWGLPPHDPAMHAISKAQRARLTRGIGFSASQLRNWRDTKCARCNGTDRLQLDHILCMAAGGKSERANAQTLCWGCHRWKTFHVDRPLVRQQFLSGGE